MARARSPKQMSQKPSALLSLRIENSPESQRGGSAGELEFVLFSNPPR
jgi:hypothetical protein